MSSVIIIPAQLESVRLPRKVLMDMGGVPMIVQVARRALESGVSKDVYVACSSEEIADAVKEHGVKHILTDPVLPSGTDRVFAAFSQLPDKDKFEYVINLQGDLPFIEASIIGDALKTASEAGVDIGTVASRVSSERADSENVVTVVLDKKQHALYFSRSSIPHGAQIYYEHIGVYCYKVEALKRFVALPQSHLEEAEKLEQLRALEDGMVIGVDVNDLEPPIAVDVGADYLKVLERYC